MAPKGTHTMRITVGELMEWINMYKKAGVIDEESPVIIHAFFNTGERHEYPVGTVGFRRDTTDRAFGICIEAEELKT